MCLYPQLIKNPKYKHTKPIDGRVALVPIGCGDCIECAKKKANQWRIRLNEEIKHKEIKGYFVTLTFSTEQLKKLDTLINKDIKGYNRDNAIATRAVRLFTERWRKKYKKTIRHWLISELGHGETEHIHLHGIIWSNEDFEEVRRIWGYGFVYPRPYQVKNNNVNIKTINYIIKYVTKKDLKHKYYKNIILTSNGIGEGVKLTPYEILNDCYKTKTGHEQSLPIYYRNKIYDEHERERRWIEKIEKNTRWINGTKVDSNDIETIHKLLIQGQKESEKKGYKGTNIKWKEKEYENTQRELMRMERYKNWKK